VGVRQAWVYISWQTSSISTVVGGATAFRGRGKWRAHQDIDLIAGANRAGGGAAKKVDVCWLPIDRDADAVELGRHLAGRERGSHFTEGYLKGRLQFGWRPWAVYL